jgi:hypothetical protein
MKRSSLRKFVGRYHGDNEQADAKLTLHDPHEDGVFEHTHADLRLTVRIADCGVPYLWKIRWQHTLSYLRAVLPDYIEEHCPDPEAAAAALGRLVSPEHGIFFPCLTESWGTINKRWRPNKETAL